MFSNLTIHPLLWFFGPLAFLADAIVTWLHQQGVKTMFYTNAYGQDQSADQKDIRASLSWGLLANVFLAVAVVALWQPLIRPAITNLLLNPAPVVQPNVPVIVVPSQTLTATPLPTETNTPTVSPTPTLTVTPTMTPTVTPVSPMTSLAEAEAYIQNNCMWVSKTEREAMVAINPDANFRDTLQSQAILTGFRAAYPEIDIDEDDLNVFVNMGSEERHVCPFAEVMLPGHKYVSYIFVNDKGEWVEVSYGE